MKMKYFLVMVISISNLTLYSQDFSTKFYFKDGEGRIDSVLIGYTENATDSLNNSLGEIKLRFSNRLYQCGIKHEVPRNTLAKANENRDWRIYSDLALVLVGIARPLYQDDNNFRLDLDNLVYAFDSSTISLCLNICRRATSRYKKMVLTE